MMHNFAAPPAHHQRWATAAAAAHSGSVHTHGCCCRATSACSAYTTASSSSHHELTQPGRRHSLSIPRCTAGSTTPPADDEAARLATAATILLTSAGRGQLEAAADGEPNGLMVADADATTTSSVLALPFIDDLTELDADSLSLAVGILRQHQPPGDAHSGGDADVQLSERLQDLLVLLRQRPGDAAAAGSDRQPPATASVDCFWSLPDEWADVRAALMSIGINASLDEDDQEAARGSTHSVWTEEAGGVLARRCGCTVST